MLTAMEELREISFVITVGADMYFIWQSDWQLLVWQYHFLETRTNEFNLVLTCFFFFFFGNSLLQ